MWIILHAALMVMMSVMITVAALVARKRGVHWFSNHKRLALFGSLSGISGVFWIFCYKAVKGYPHFTSSHARIGLLILMLLIITPLLGILISKGKIVPHKAFGRVTVLFVFVLTLSGIIRMLHMFGIMGTHD